MSKNLTVRKFKKNDYFSDFDSDRNDFKSDRKKDAKKKSRPASDEKRRFDHLLSEDF